MDLAERVDVHCDTELPAGLNGKAQGSGSLVLGGSSSQHRFAPILFISLPDIKNLEKSRIIFSMLLSTDKSN